MTGGILARSVFIVLALCLGVAAPCPSALARGKSRAATGEVFSAPDIANPASPANSMEEIWKEQAGGQPAPELMEEAASQPLPEGSSPESDLEKSPDKKPEPEKGDNEDTQGKEEPSKEEPSKEEQAQEEATSPSIQSNKQESAQESQEEQQEDANLPPRRRLSVGIGGIIHNIGSKSANQSSGAAKTSIGTPFVALFLAGRVGGPRFLWVPEFSFTPFGISEGDQSTTKRVFAVSSPAGLRLGPTELRTGPGVLLYTLTGDGGRVQLDNGLSTATFYLPDRSSSVRLFYWLVGFGAWLGKSGLRVDMDAWVTRVMGNPRGSLALRLHCAFL